MRFPALKERTQQTNMALQQLGINNYVAKMDFDKEYDSLTFNFQVNSAADLQKIAEDLLNCCHENNFNKLLVSL